jgi:hypothetical protein
METTNPAGRLHLILSSAFERSKPNPNISASVLWSLVFEIAQDPDYEIEVITKLLQLRLLIKETEESLRSIEGLTEKYFRPFDRIRPIADRSLTSLSGINAQSVISGITEGDMTVLEFCSEKLDERHAEPVINEAELQEILLEVNSLFDEVAGAQIDAELKSFVLDSLEAIRRGINEYRIRGPKRLKEALADVIGNLAVNRDVVKAGSKVESVGRFEKLCYRFAAVVSFASDAAGLLTAMKVGLLPGA